MLVLVAKEWVVCVTSATQPLRAKGCPCDCSPWTRLWQRASACVQQLLSAALGSYHTLHCRQVEVLEQGLVFPFGCPYLDWPQPSSILLCHLKSSVQASMRIIHKSMVVTLVWPTLCRGHNIQGRTACLGVASTDGGRHAPGRLTVKGAIGPASGLDFALDSDQGGCQINAGCASECT